jgi:hypothetical protein
MGRVKSIPTSCGSGRAFPGRRADGESIGIAAPAIAEMVGLTNDSCALDRIAPEPELVYEHAIWHFGEYAQNAIPCAPSQVNGNRSRCGEALAGFSAAAPLALSGK